MAISWGSWEYGNSSAGFRVGLDVSQSSVTSSSTSVTWTVKVYVEAMYNVNDLMTVTASGNISGSDEQNMTTGSSGGTKLWFTKTHTYNYSTYGSSPGTRSFTASLSGAYNGATPSKTVTVTIPARPYAAPAAPSAVTATRNSDTQATVAWTRNATSAAPYTSVTVQRGVWNGSAWSAWSTVATTSSTATSFVDSGVATNNQYRYQVKANNSAGASAYVAAAAYVKMTPAAPTNAAAALQSSGTSIVLTWTNNHYNDTFIDLTVQRSVAGGAYATVATLTDHTLTTWTDNAPGAGTNTYRVTAVQTTGSLSSAAATSNTVSTTVPPLAPTNLSPNGVARDGAQDIALSWQHNPGGDGAAQTAFTVEYSTNGGTNWTSLGEVVSSAQSATIVAPFWANGQTVLWRVKTRGVASAGYGPVSGSATITTSATPVTTITGPPTTLTALPAVVTWTYSQAQSSAQSAWEVSLTRDGQTVEAASGTTGTSYTLTAPLEQGASYTLSVRARSAAGIWSTTATRSLTVSLLPPGGVVASPEYQPDTGTTVVSLAATPAPGATRTNLATASWGTTGWTSNNTYWTRTNGVALDDHPLGIPTGVRVVTGDTLPAGDPAMASQYNIDGLANSMTVRGAGVWVKPSVDGIAEVYFSGNEPASKGYAVAPAGVWTYVTTAATSNMYAIVRVLTADGSGAVAGTEVLMTGSISEAGVAAPSYFDGSSHWGKWSGTAGASTSTLAAANAVATVSATVERRVPGGEWVTIHRDVPLPNDVLDLLPATAGTTEYRVTSKSATPTYRVERVVTVSPNGGDWLFVNYGDGFTNVLRLRSNPDVKVTAGREKVAQRFLGRSKPVPAFGQSRTRVVSASGDLVHDPAGVNDPAGLWDSPPMDWETAAQESDVVCFRDFIGRRVFGLLSDVNVAHRAPGLGSVGFNVEETEWAEDYV